MRTLRRAIDAAEKTANRNCSLLMAWEQENVKRMPPGLIFRKAMALRRLYP